MHGCKQFLIRSVVHITLGRISRARSVKAKVLQKAFLLNYDFESNFNETDWVSPLIKRSPYSMILVYAYLLGIAQTLVSCGRNCKAQCKRKFNFCLFAWFVNY